MKPILSAPITFATSFLFVTFLLQWWQQPSYPLALWLPLALLIPLSFLLHLSRPHHIHHILILALLLGSTLALGNVARTTKSADADKETLTPSLGKYLNIDGAVATPPDRRQEKVLYTIAVTSITPKGSDTPVPARGRIRATVWGGPSIAYGDRVRVRGILERPPPPYDHVLAVEGITSTMHRASIAKTGTARAWSPLRTLSQWNTGIEQVIQRIYPEPEASLLAGLLLGLRGGIPRELLSDFSLAGLTHILAISGYNITLVLIVLAATFAFLPAPVRLLLSLCGIAMFILLVGGSSSAVRAAVMGGLGLLGVHCKRIPETRHLLLWAAFAMVLWNPLHLFWDASFQLSFLAVIGIIECSPFFQRAFQHMPETIGIRETLTMTIAAQTGALPWAALLFGTLPILSPFANILAAPAIPVSMGFGVIALLAHTLHPLLGLIAMLPGWIALHWIILVAKYSAHITEFLPTLPPPTLLIVTMYYLTLGIFLIRKFQKEHVPAIQFPLPVGEGRVRGPSPLPPI